MSRHSINHGEHALVIGCSFAGLFAARVLSDHFERVTVIEGDSVNRSSGISQRQPQTRHLHRLLAQGLRIIKQLFPSLEQTLVDGGANTDLDL